MLFRIPLFHSISITPFYTHISGDIGYNVCLLYNLFIKFLIVSRYNDAVIIGDMVIVFIVYIENKL